MGHRQNTSKPRSRPHHSALTGRNGPARQHPHHLQTLQPVKGQRGVTQTSTLPAGGGHRPPQPVV